MVSSLGYMVHGFERMGYMVSWVPRYGVHIFSLPFLGVTTNHIWLLRSHYITPYHSEAIRTCSL